MDRSDAEQLDHIEAHVLNACAGHDPAHDVAHVRRVIANARAILSAESESGPVADEFIVMAACWLHDVVQLPKGGGQPGESARRSAAEARRLLGPLGVAPGRIDHICAAVGAHSYSGGERPATIEAEIVQDADRLDALGAIGLARLWVIAGQLGSQLYHPTDPLAADRPLEDARYALDHIASKLLKLPQLMHTPTARRLAHDRAAFIEEYRERLLEEVCSS